MKRCYSFAVYITAEEAKGYNGYSQDEVDLLLKTTLNYYDAPLNRERSRVKVDYELMSIEEVK